MGKRMRNNIQNFIMFALVIVLFASVGRCNFNERNATLNLNALSDTITYYTNKLGTQTAGIKTLRLTGAQLKETILDKDKQLTILTKQFSRTQNIIKYTEQIKYDTIHITFKDTVPHVFAKNGTVNSDWYSLKYNVTNKGVIIDSLTIPNQTTVITGFNRKWLLGKEILMTNVTHSNPYVTVTALQAVTVVVPVPWYKKWYVWLAGGIAGGFLIAR
jgi:hypothetical protein